MKKFDVKRVVIDAAFSAIAVVLYCFLKWPMPALFPSFLEFNFSMLPIIILLFTFGPSDGILAAIIRMIGKLIFMGTGTAYVGELADLLLAILICLSVGTTYKFISKRTNSEPIRALLSMVVVVLTWTVSAIVLNWLVLLPAYIELFFGGSTAPIIGACKCIKGINESNYMPMYLFGGVLPFNLCLSIGICAISYLVHMSTYMVFSQAKMSKQDVEEVFEDKE